MVVRTGWFYVLLALALGVGCSDAGDIEPDPIVVDETDETEDDDTVLIGDLKDNDPVPEEEAAGDSPVVEDDEPVAEEEEPVAEEGEEEEPIADDIEDDVEDSTPEFDPIVVVRPFPAIENAPIIAGVDVVDEVVAKELVLGVVVNGEARAYSINMLTGPTREIINDTLGGRDIAATW